MILTELEEDILGDMQHDTHELWEWYSFIRTHYPDMDEDKVIEYGYELLEKWVNRDWLVFYPSRSGNVSLSPDKFLLCVRELGNDAAKADFVLELSLQASKDVEWLKPFNLVGPR